MKSDEMIKKSIFRMLFSYRMFGNLACSLQRVESKTIPTMATDAKKMYYNDEFVKTLPEEELTFIVAHEVLHAALGHANPYRQGGRNIIVVDSMGNRITLWNVACDYVVNYLIQAVIDEAAKASKKCFMRMPKQALYDAKYFGKTVEVVYSELAQESKNWQQVPIPGGSGAGSMPMIPGGKTLVDDHIPGELLKTMVGDAEAKNLEGQWKNRLEKEIISAKQRGDISGAVKCLESLISTEEKVDWRETLNNYVMNMYKSVYQLNPPNKRFFHLNMVMPSVQGEHIDVALAVDTSGSMLSYLPEIYGELQHIFEAFDSYDLTLIEADCNVDAVYNYSFGESFQDNIPKGTGGGGTSFIPAIRWVQENKPDVKVMVYCTDGWGAFPEVPPDFDVIWVTPKGCLDPEKFPFGDVVVYIPEDK
jgi:predicted metal-dependent peptidase